MIRQDYIIDWIKRYIQWLTEIVGLAKAEKYQAAMQQIDFVLEALLGINHDALLDLSEGEIVAQLALGEPLPALNERCAYLAALLKQLGIALAAQGSDVESQRCFLKALHLGLGLRLQQTPQWLVDYAPTLDDLWDRLNRELIPVRTYAALMISHEQAGQFAKAEDDLFAMLERESENQETLAIGLAFYHRLQGLSDETLVMGNLPRDEVEAGMAELLSRRTI